MDDERGINRAERGNMDDERGINGAERGNKDDERGIIGPSAGSVRLNTQKSLRNTCLIEPLKNKNSG